MYFTDLRAVRDALQRKLDKAIAQADDFQTSVGSSSTSGLCDLLCSSDGAFAAAARESVYGKLVAAIDRKLSDDSESGLTVDKLEEHVLSELVQLAGTVPSSTSPTSNLMRQHERVAWAEVQRLLTRGF